eukprot:gene5204-6329_t
MAENVSPILDDNAPQSSRSTTIIAFTTALSYSLTYFWRYPIFLLPDDILSKPVVTLFEKKVDLHSAISMCFILGFGVAKLPAIRIMTSPFFFRNRCSVLISLYAISMLVECGGIYVFQSSPPLQAVSVFISSFFSSWIFGGLITYIEGRQKTETLLAVLSSFYVYAGNLSRGTASLVLKMGTPPLLMPLIIGSVTMPLASLLLIITDKSPGPSRADVQSRCKRSPMSTRRQWLFVADWGFGIGAMLMTYSVLTGIRSFRDFYVKQIFSAAIGESDVPSALYFLADLPGAVLSCAALVICNQVVTILWLEQDNSPSFPERMR